MRIGAVPYLNGKPLVYGLEKDVELVSAVPSKLAEMLRGDRIAAGLVSVAACFSNSDLQIVPGISISCIGPAESVRLYHRIDLGNAGCVALDTSSLTSVLLARIVLEERYGVLPEFVDMPPVVSDMLAQCDAGVLIGDPAMRASAETDAPYLDLGEEWYRMTGLPFVFAVWAVNPRLAEPGLADVLERAKTRGLDAVESISRSESERLGLSYEVCRHYLTMTMNYELTERHLEGMMLFRRFAERYGFPSVEGELRLYETD